jgi:hypothetical protein
MCKEFSRQDASALHEAGHVVFAVALGRSVKYVSVQRDDHGDGYTNRDYRCTTDEEVYEEIAILYAGQAAADFCKFITNSDDDNRKINYLLDRFSAEQRQAVLLQICSWVESRVLPLWPAIEGVARVLIADRCGDGEKLTAIVRKECPQVDSTMLRVAQN